MTEYVSRLSASSEKSDVGSSIAEEDAKLEAESHVT